MAGFVGCGMGDIGSEALLKWARQAPNLRMICVEENKLSQFNKMQFRELAAERAGLLVVAAARFIGITDKRLWRIVDHCVH